MVKKKSWEEFRKTGMLWWVNMVLHTFGWSIVIIIKDGKVTDAYPARVKFRGFNEKNNTEGYIKVSEFMEKEAALLSAEAKE